MRPRLGEPAQRRSASSQTEAQKVHLPAAAPMHLPRSSHVKDPRVLATAHASRPFRCMYGDDGNVYVSATSAETSACILEPQPQYIDAWRRGAGRPCEEGSQTLRHVRRKPNAHLAAPVTRQGAHGPFVVELAPAAKRMGIRFDKTLHVKERVTHMADNASRAVRGLQLLGKDGVWPAPNGLAKDLSTVHPPVPHIRKCGRLGTRAQTVSGRRPRQGSNHGTATDLCRLQDYPYRHGTPPSHPFSSSSIYSAMALLTVPTDDTPLARPCHATQAW